MVKTLKDKEIEDYNFKSEKFIYYCKSSDIKKHLDNFYKEYWQSSSICDKNKRHITCDKLDYLMDKHFGSLIKVKTLQKLENQYKK